MVKLLKQMRPVSYGETRPTEDGSSRLGVGPPHIATCFPGSGSSSPSTRWSGDDYPVQRAGVLRRTRAKPGRQTGVLCPTQYHLGRCGCGRNAAPEDALSPRPMGVWAAFENQSMTVRIVVWPLERGRLVIKSSVICYHGCYGNSSGVSRTAG